MPLRAAAYALCLWCVTLAGKYRNNKPGPRPVVLLHHGITLSSACWTLLNANESTAYILADAGELQTLSVVYCCW
jgi:hypothetical protein